MNTIINRMKKVLLEIAENPRNPVQDRLNALSLFSEVRGLTKKRNRTTTLERPKLSIPPAAILGSK